MNNLTAIEEVGKGAAPDPLDYRDYRAENVMGAPDVDWSEPFLLPAPPQQDQANSLSCVAHAWSYYHWQLTGREYSRRDIYANIYLSPQGGAYIRDGGLRILNVGQATIDEVEDPVPQTENAMRSKIGLDNKFSESDREHDSFLINTYDIDAVAMAIKNYRGVVFGVTGSNAGWRDGASPRPPLPGEVTWGHALYLYGYHMHGSEKCVIARSSWGYVPNHHITEPYFTSGNTFNPWTLIPKPQQGMEFLRIHDRKLGQDAEQSGGFALIKDGKLLVADKDRLPALIATAMVLGRGGVSIPAAVWNAAPKEKF